MLTNVRHRFRLAMLCATACLVAAPPQFATAAAPAVPGVPVPGPGAGPAFTPPPSAPPSGGGSTVPAPAPTVPSTATAAAAPGSTSGAPMPGMGGGTTVQQFPPPAAQGAGPLPGTWCAGHRIGTLSPKARLAGQNLARLRAAQAELAPGFESGKATTGIDLLAAYQEELEKSRPDRAAAASYLALASAVPITPARLRSVNALLCISTTAAAARAIATEAEAERVQMSR